jgi:superfamily II DNA or RNA helicase
VLLVLPTSAGKTVTAGALIAGALDKGNKVMFLAHRKELIDQPSELLDKLGIDHGVIKAGHWRQRPDLPVQVASVQTLARRGTRPDVRVVIVDEAHRRLAQMYEDVFADYPNALILGLTATPIRLDGRGLHRVFDEMVVGASYSQLLERDPPALCQPRMFVPDVPDLADVPVSHGEYQRASLGARMTGQLIGKIVTHWLEHARGRPTVCFAPTIDKSLAIVEDFRRQGIAAAHVDGKMTDAERTTILKRLAHGELDVVSNVDLLVEGYDLPRLSALILARPTKSISRYLQMCGRVGRVDASKTDALIFDHAGCYFEHGHPTDDREWSLEDGYKAERTISLFYICEVCFAAVPRGQVCPTCGSAKIREVRRGVVEETDDALVEMKRQMQCRECGSPKVTVTRGPGPFDMRLRCRDCDASTWIFDTKKAARASLEQRRVEYRRLVLVAHKNSYQLGWAKHRYRDCFGVFPDRRVTA